MIYFSTNRFGAILLGKLAEKTKPSLVITKQDKPRGRKKILSPTPVKETARKLGIEYLSPENLKEKDFLKKLKEHRSELFLVAGYGKIIPREILEIAKFKILNIHPSLLPKYRGPTPIQSAILNGESITGITIHLLNDKIDTGDIISQRKIRLEGKENYLEAEEKLAKLGAELFSEILDPWLKGKIVPRKQNEKEATYTKKLDLSDGEIFPCRERACQVERKVRALNPEPGTFLRIEKQGKEAILKILEAEILENIKKNCWTFFKFEKKLALSCKGNSLLIKKVQLAGKKPMSSEDFLLGNKWIIS